MAGGEDAGAGLVDRWLVYRMCIRDGLLRIVALDRRVCTLRIACVYGKRIGTEQRSDVVAVSKNDGLRLETLVSPKLQKIKR